MVTVILPSESPKITRINQSQVTNGPPQCALVSVSLLKKSFISPIQLGGGVGKVLFLCSLLFKAPISYPLGCAIICGWELGPQVYLLSRCLWLMAHSCWWVSPGGHVLSFGKVYQHLCSAPPGVSRSCTGWKFFEKGTCWAHGRCEYKHFLGNFFLFLFFCSRLSPILFSWLWL